jgi:peptide chain release factor subunit 3
MKKAEAKRNTDPAELKKREEEKKKKKTKDVNVEADASCVEVDTTRDPASLVFIGHVDAGKSTICGNLMFHMGVVDQRTIEQYKVEAKKQGRDSWWLAYVMDVADDEKAKGKTVEMGRAYFNTPTKEFTIFDAPGHKNYVPNMIMGASLADFGGLVISARKGEFEAGFHQEGQTREHVQLARSLGIQ